ncbi:hypothetical protein O181_079245 [Austropuccinia psidii MF-1]|uniref:Uncharacterized protein n=1 Tax=Austropuccinia psidii MF-1 TaxID=1389203 RepID=A0A9Q3IHQ8_9BASI|nr:hypothetical protein [Austropuccinia psidii MF-1]
MPTAFHRKRKESMPLKQLPEEESPKEDSESYSIGDAIREHSDDYQDPKEEFLVEYQGETQLEIQDIQLEAGMPQDTANKNLCKNTKDAQTFLVTPTRGMAYIHGTSTKMTVCIDNAQHPLIINSGSQCSIVAREYLDNLFPNLERKIFITMAKNFQRPSGKMKCIGTIIKEIIIPNRKGNIRLNPAFEVLEDAHIQKFLLGTDYQIMYGIYIYNSKNRHITIDPLEVFLNELKEGKLSANLTSKQKISLLKRLRKDRPAFAIGEEPLGTIGGHDIEIYLDVKRRSPLMLRRPPYPENLETRKEIEKHINELLDIDVITKIGNNEIVEIPTPVFITFYDGKFRL